MDHPRHSSQRRRHRNQLVAHAVAVLAFALGAQPSLAGAADLSWSSDWRRVGTPEYVVAPTLLALTGAAVLLLDGPSGPSWSKPILFDDATRDALVAGTAGGRKTVATVSDVLVATSVVHPVLIDGVVVPWAGHGSSDVAWQLVWIDAQAYAISAALNTAVKYAVARERPWGGRCPGPGLDCSNTDRNLSFYSGHSATAATGAGLTCAHHSHLSLYGSPAADVSACIGAVALALTTGTLRIVADKHWASDVLVGEVLGFASGYLIPTLVYYGSWSSPTSAQQGGLSTATVAPGVAPGALSLSVSGRF
jgi:membrane-associated phospholipid phosphatase